MRVLYVNQTATVSGAEHSLLNLLPVLGAAVDPVVACPEGPLAQAVRSAGVRHEPITGTQASFRIHPLYTPQSLAEIARSAAQIRGLARRLGADLVHANNTRASLLAILGRHRRPPILASIRDWMPDGRLPRLVNAVIARRADLVIASSTYVAGQFDGLPARRPVRVIPETVDLAGFDPQSIDGSVVRNELDLSSRTVVLAVVAQLTPWKGQDDAIRILAALRKSGRDASLLLVGSALFTGRANRYDNVAFTDQLKTAAAGAGVSDHVKFLGQRSDIPSVLAATDLLLIPSWREAFGRIAVEAMAMSVPVIATETGGPADIIRDGIDGLLLPSRSPELWARRSEPLVDQAEVRLRMGREAQVRAREFALSSGVDLMLDAYRELVGPSAGESERR